MYRFQVAPSELEDLLLRNPHVIDAAVCAVYDSTQATEIPMAYVSLQPNLVELEHGAKKKILDDIHKWFDTQVAGYKKLRGGVNHLQVLPKTASGKILRKDLPAKLRETRYSSL